MILPRIKLSGEPGQAQNLDLPSVRCDLLILLEKKPDSKFVPFVERLGIGLAWMQGKRVVGGSLATKMLRGVA